MAKKEKPTPVYIVRRTSPVTWGCTFLLGIGLLSALIGSCSDKPSVRAEPEKVNSKTTTAQESSPVAIATVAPTQAPTQAPTATPDITKPIIGLSRDAVIAKFSAARRDPGYETNVDPHAIKLVTDPILIIVYFDARNVAEGVAFLSNAGYMGDPMTGSGSYVHKNYQMLLQNATGGAQYAVKVNSTTKYPVEMRVGNCHE